MEGPYRWVVFFTEFAQHFGIIHMLLARGEGIELSTIGFGGQSAPSAPRLFSKEKPGPPCRSLASKVVLVIVGSLVTKLNRAPILGIILRGEYNTPTWLNCALMFGTKFGL